MEHLKTVLKHIGLPVTIVKAAKSIGVVHSSSKRLQHFLFHFSGRSSSVHVNQPELMKVWITWWDN